MALTQKVLIDTSAWITFFRPGEGAVSDFVAVLIQHEQAAITGPVIAELLQGVRNSKERKHLQFVLGCVAYLEVIQNDWETTGTTLQSLRARGITLPLTDALIGTVAARCKLPVLTLDRHFKHLSYVIAICRDRPLCLPFVVEIEIEIGIRSR